MILASDFNKLDLKPTAKAFQLKPTINFPTRGEILDQIFINLSEYYSPPASAPPFGLSDHITITVSPGIREKLQKPRPKVIKVRDKRPIKIASVGRFLLQVPWPDLLSHDQSCDDKMSILTEIVNYGLDTIMPERSIRVHETDRPWMNSQLKSHCSSTKSFYIREWAIVQVIAEQGQSRKEALSQNLLSE